MKPPCLLASGLVVAPGALAVLLAGGPEKACITGDAVVVDVLPIRHVRYLGVAADTERPIRAMLDELHLDLLIPELRLAESLAEKLGGDAAVLLAKLHPNPISVAMYNTGLGHGLTRDAHAHQSREQYR